MGVLITIGLKYLILLQGNLYSNKNQSNEMLGLCLFSIIIVCKDDVFLAFKLQIVKGFVPGFTGWLHQMGLMVVTIKIFSLVLQQPILIGWD